MEVTPALRPCRCFSAMMGERQPRYTKGKREVRSLLLEVPGLQAG